MNRAAVLLLSFMIALPNIGIAQAPDLTHMDVVLRSVPDGPVAKVRGTNITKTDFVKFYQNELTRFEQSSGTPMPDEARIQLAITCVRALARRELLYQDALEKGLTVPRDQVENTWERQLAVILKQITRISGAETTETDALKSLGYRDRNEVLAEMEHELLIEKRRQQVINEKGPNINDEAVAAFYEQEKARFARPGLITLRQIFVRSEGGKSTLAQKEREAARMKIDDALNRILSGQSFEGLARTISDGHARNQGGIMGPLPLSQMPPFLVDAALPLQPDETSDVIKSEFGFHIVQLLALDPGSEISLEEASDTIRQLLSDLESGDVVQQYCESLVSDPSEVVVYLELEKNYRLATGQ